MIDIELIKALKRGTRRMSDESLTKLCAYVKSQMSRGAVFKNRAGKEDIYYTMFGWLLCYTLGIKTDKNVRREYLKGIDRAQLDELHTIVYKQCVMLDDLMSYGMILAAVKHIGDRKHIEDFFEAFSQHTTGESLNGLAAGFWTNKVPREYALKQIDALQDKTGGFYQTTYAQMPDLLSTAVALFTLNAAKSKTRYNPTDFVVAHVNDNGSWAPNVLDTDSDVEYCFYGLLALGSIDDLMIG